jgi:hypothetical protein
MAQIGLSYAQQSNWAYNYAPAQVVLVRADALIKASCAAARTDADLVALRNSILAYLADAARQQVNPQPWK